MKIGIYAHWNVVQDAGRVFTVGCNARYLRHFLDMTDGVRLFTTLAANPHTQNLDCIRDPRLEVVPVPGGNYASAWLRQRELRRTVESHLDGLDALYVRLFDPCPWVVARPCEARGIGLVFDMVGDPVAGIWHRRDWSLTGRLVRRLMFLPEEILTFRAARRHLLLLNGGTIAASYGRRHPAPETVFSSTLEPGDFFLRQDTCQGDIITVLYVGMLRPAKGVETLLDAVASLLREGRPIRLRIVGGGDPPAYVASLRARIREAALDEYVELVGFVALGERLNTEYRSADIYAFPSMTEGAARTLLEAAAQSLPCVMTDVGGARDLFCDGESALLVPPGDPEAMSRAIARLIDDEKLRRRCIRNAYQVAARNTCRDFIHSMVRRLAASRARYGIEHDAA